jgi:hypothetical protein
MCILTCGNEPPEEFYEGTPEDDAKIDDILNNDYPELLVTTDGFVETYTEIQPVSLPPVVFEDQDRIFRADSPIVKQHIDSSAFVQDTLHRYYDRWYAKDTTCTVYLWDTFYVESWYHVDLVLVGHYDSMYIGPTGDTNYVLRTIDTIVPAPPDDYDFEDIYGDGRRHIFLEPRRSTTPTIDPETGDTTYAMIEPFEWQLRRISYGQYYYPTRGTDAPAVSRVLISSSSDPLVVDTIMNSNTDTLYTGHVMNRFKAIDSLLEYTGLDTLEVTIEIDDPEQAADVVCYAVCNDVRINLGPIAVGARGFIPVTGQGIVNLYFEAVFTDSYYYVDPNQGYFATVWLIPVMVN